MNTKLENLIQQYNHQCVWCGRKLWEQQLTVEHLCPKSKGGRGGQENLLLACNQCNWQRKSKSAVSFAEAKEQKGFNPQWDVLSSALQLLSNSEIRKQREWAKKQLNHLVK
jgi:5-methylcytosine-specific restriction endonuclease McrA